LTEGEGEGRHSRGKNPYVGWGQGKEDGEFAMNFEKEKGVAWIKNLIDRDVHHRAK